jgi:hypothetical protein
MSATGCPQTVLLPNGNGPVCVQPAILRLTLCTMMTGLYDYHRICLG